MSLLVRLFSLLANARSVRTSWQRAQASVKQIHATARKAQTVVAQHQRLKAEAGDPEAQYDWGERYYDGLGLPQDYGLAAEWFHYAAEQGHAQAQCNLGMMYFIGRGVPQDACEAYKWIQLSARQGNPKATRALQSIMKRMAPDQIAQGQWRADHFIPRSQAS
jgi:TPR repeat protein